LTAQRRPRDPATVDAEVTAQSFAAAPRRATVEIRAGRGRALVARAPIELPAGGRLTHRLSFAAPADAALEAALVAEAAGVGDRLGLDDRVYAVLPEPRVRRVLIAGAPNLYLDGALLSLGAEIATERVAGPALDARRAQLASYDVVIFDGVAPAPPPTEGRYLYLDPAGPGSPFPERGKVRDPLPSELDRAHPLLAHVAMADLNIREARRLAIEPRDQVVAASLGVPLLVARARPALRVVALSFDPRRSDLPLRPTFPLLLANALDWLAGAPARAVEAGHRTGTSARVRLPGHAVSATVQDAGGAVTRRTAVDGWLELPLARSGHYRITPERPAGPALTIAASLVEPAESNTRASPSATFVRLAGKPPSAARPRAAHLGPGGVALLVAALLLLLEWWTFHRRWTV
jgi:hypothetical protein